MSDSWLILVFLFSVLIYFAPTILAWRLKRSATPLLGVFIVNVLIGWTVVGWCMCWFLIFWNPLGRISSGGGSWTAGRPLPIRNVSQPTERRSCGACYGSKTQPCPSCGGQRGKWVYPTTEAGSSRWEGCSYCMQSGTIACGHCGGSGERAY